jgi:hypothetical protein
MKVEGEPERGKEERSKNKEQEESEAGTPRKETRSEKES